MKTFKAEQEPSFAAVVNDQLLQVSIVRRRRLLGIFPQVLVSYRMRIRGDDGKIQYETGRVKWVSEKNLIQE